jgi:hypothetical protein
MRNCNCSSYKTQTHKQHNIRSNHAKPHPSIIYGGLLVDALNELLGSSLSYEQEHCSLHLSSQNGSWGPSLIHRHISTLPLHPRICTVDDKICSLIPQLTLVYAIHLFFRSQWKHHFYPAHSQFQRQSFIDTVLRLFFMILSPNPLEEMIPDETNERYWDHEEYQRRN